MKRLACLMLLALTVLACGSDSDAESASECEKICQSSRQGLIDNFGIAPERIDCSDPKWKGTCQDCQALMRNAFDVTPECPPTGS